MLASSSLLSLCLPSRHANTIRIFPTCRRLCWRRPPRKAFVFHQATPTQPGFSQPAGAGVGAGLPAKPLSSVKSRQHGPAFSGSQAPVLAPTSPQSLYLPSGHANTARLFPARGLLCWRRPPRKAFFFRRGTPTRPDYPNWPVALAGCQE